MLVLNKFIVKILCANGVNSWILSSYLERMTYAEPDFGQEILNITSKMTQRIFYSTSHSEKLLLSVHTSKPESQLIFT